MDDKGDMRMRVIAQLALTVEEDSGFEQAVQAAHIAELEPYELVQMG